MSWDADLIFLNDLDTRFSWNYTHNTNPMVNDAIDREPGDPTWWDQLDGMTGAQGAAFLTRIITALEADPDRYRAMDPPNGWGSYDSLLPVLRDMLTTCTTEEPCLWVVSG